MRYIIHYLRTYHQTSIWDAISQQFASTDVFTAQNAIQLPVQNTGPLPIWDWQHRRNDNYPFYPDHLSQWFVVFAPHPRIPLLSHIQQLLDNPP